MDEEGIGKFCRFCIGFILMLSFCQIMFVGFPLVHNAQAGSIWIQDREEDFLMGTMNGIAILGSGPDAELQLGVDETGPAKHHRGDQTVDGAKLPGRGGSEDHRGPQGALSDRAPLQGDGEQPRGNRWREGIHARGDLGQDIGEDPWRHEEGPE